MQMMNGDDRWKVGFRNLRKLAWDGGYGKKGQGSGQSGDIISGASLQGS